MSLTLLPALGPIFLLLGCLVSSKYDGILLVLLYLVLWCWLLSLRGQLISEVKEREGERIMDGWGLWGSSKRGVEGEETVVRMGCMREESIF